MTSASSRIIARSQGKSSRSVPGGSTRVKERAKLFDSPGNYLLQLLFVVSSIATPTLGHGPPAVLADQLGGPAFGIESPDSPHSVKQVTGDVIAIKEGADLDLSCPIVVQNEDMIISWTCENEPANIRSSRIHVTDSGKLRIHSAKVGDSCNYRCEAADGFGTLSVVIKVIIVDRRLMDQLAGRLSGPTHGPGVDVPKSSSPGHQQISSADGQRRPGVQMDGDAGIEIQIEPAQVRVAENKTIALECRIKYAPHLVLPQITWLKEYTGDGVDSINEALERNLITLDGVFYHSLNWPRAITYSHMSSTASSALLIRQSNRLHSGRYICFAGYPGSIMNLHSNNSFTSNASATATAYQTDRSQENLTSSSRSQMKYKLARAVVVVDAEEGGASHVSSWLSRGMRQDDARDPSNIFVNVITTNSWMRNLTLAVIVLCCLLVLVKTLQIRWRNTKKSAQAAVQDNSPEAEISTGAPLVVSALSSPPVVVLSPSHLSDTLPDRYSLSLAPANSLITSTNPLGEEYKIDQDLLNERLNCIHMTNSDNSNDHVYSEIGYQITISNQEEPYYKQPNRKNKQ